MIRIQDILHRERADREGCVRFCSSALKFYLILVDQAIAKALQTKVYSDARKTAILRCQSDAELDSLLTSDPLAAGVHLLPLGTIASDKLKIYMERWKGHFDKAIGFRPTGWTYVLPVPTPPTIHS